MASISWTSLGKLDVVFRTRWSCAFLVVVAASVLSTSQGYHVTLTPLPGKGESQSGRDSAILVIPEMGVAHTDYKVLCRIIQQLYPLRLWISLVDISKEGALTLDNLPLLLAEAITEMTSEGLQEDTTDMFLAAHGTNGHLAADYAQAVPYMLRGLVLWGTSLPKRFNVTSFPLPVLTVVGEIDGVARITRIAETVQMLMRAAEFEPAIVTNIPIVMLEGSNHGVFVVGDLPLSLHIVDIEEEEDKTVSMERAANVTAMFLAKVAHEPESFVEMAAEEFKRSFARAVNLTEPIRTIRELTQDNLKSYWVKSAQKWLSGLEGKDSTQLEVDSYVVRERGEIALPPALVMEHGINYVITFSDIIHSRGNQDDDDDNAAFPQAPDEIAARMLGPERIKEYLKNTTIAHNYTCRDLNYASFQTAYHIATDRARKRYDNYHRGVIFESDVVTDSEALWESTRLKTETISQVLHVTSISYQTPNDESLTQYAGLFFCKLLPPDRALEWIYVDSLRRSMPYREKV